MRVRLAVIGTTAAFLLAACGDFIGRLNADVVTVNLLLETGDPFGLLPRQAGVLVNLAAITGPLNDPSTTPISGADVTMTISTGAGTVYTFPEADPGVYSSSSGATPTVVYQSGATYAISIEIAEGEYADTYTTQVIAPRRTDATGFPDPLLGQFHPANTELVLTIVGSYDKGLVVVFNDQGDITYDSRPSTPAAAVEFALGNFNGTVTIPGTAFPESGKSYGIMVAGLESATGSGISPNLQILSRFFAGSSKTAIIVTN